MLLPGAGDSSYPLIRAWPFPLQPLISQVPHHLHQGFPGFWKQQCQGAGRVAFQDLTALSHEVEASGPSQGGSVFPTQEPGQSDRQRVTVA